MGDTDADSSTDTFFRCFSSGNFRLWTSSNLGDRVLMAVRNQFFHQEISGYGHLQSSHQRDHQEVAGYCACYGPLQRSHQGDHHEIVGYGPLQSSHQGYRHPTDQ